jgi:hypothetical protein
MKRHIPAQAGIQGDMRNAPVWLALAPRLRGGAVGETSSFRFDGRGRSGTPGRARGDGWGAVLPAIVTPAEAGVHWRWRSGWTRRRCVYGFPPARE